MNAAFVTFGCRLNRAEALDAEARFAAAGHRIVQISTSGGNPGDAPDVIIVRGCSVTARAQRDCEKAIARLRTRFPRAEVRITGCLPGAVRNPPLPLSNASFAAAGAIAAEALPASTRASRAYLKVQDGCSGGCAYCIVPRFRGAPRSVPFAKVLDRARAFLEAGFREIVVTGCNLALYRDDGRGLPALVSALAALPASEPHRIRLGSVEPRICGDALLDAFAAHPNVCRHLHLSLQSASDAVLRRMRRPYSAAAVAAFCAAARARLGPRLALGADVICGFPGETDADFNLTREFLERAEFTHLHAFPYSERPGTPAAAMRPAVPRAQRLARVRLLEADARVRAAAFRAALVAEEVEVCVERGGSGYSSEYVRFAAPAGSPRRALVRFRPEPCAAPSTPAAPRSADRR